jgi:uncharacterized membrane protein YidH (DUF202 family)
MYRRRGVVLESVAGQTAKYTSICLSMFLFGFLNCILAGFKFSQVGFVFYLGKIRTAVNMYFMIAVGLSIVVDIMFQFHFKQCFDDLIFQK